MDGSLGWVKYKALYGANDVQIFIDILAIYFLQLLCQHFHSRQHYPQAILAFSWLQCRGQLPVTSPLESFAVILPSLLQTAGKQIICRR